MLPVYTAGGFLGALALAWLSSTSRTVESKLELIASVAYKLSIKVPVMLVDKLILVPGYRINTEIMYWIYKLTGKPGGKRFELPRSIYNQSMIGGGIIGSYDAAIEGDERTKELLSDEDFLIARGLGLIATAGLTELVSFALANYFLPTAINTLSLTTAYKDLFNVKSIYPEWLIKDGFMLQMKMDLILNKGNVEFTPPQLPVYEAFVLAIREYFKSLENNHNVKALLLSFKALGNK